MSNAVITIKTSLDTKIKAQKVAKEHGVSLSLLVNAFLHRIVETKKISLHEENPSDYLLSVMKKSEQDYKKGNASPAFKNGKDAIAWLEKQGI